MRNSASLKADSSRREMFYVCVLILAVLAVNLLTGSRCPAVWIDEAAYTDPAWNLHLGQGFTSSAWYAQAGDEFWAGNVPLHSALLYLWTGLFGFSVLAVRAMNYVLISAAAVLLWLAVRRHGLIGRPEYRLALIALMLLGFGVCFSYRSGRPDAVCILLASSSALAYSISNRPVRLIAVGGLGVLFPIAGLQLLVYAALLSLLLLPWLRTRFLGEAIVLGLGCTAGVGVLFAFYTWHGVWGDFLASTIGRHSAAGQEGLAARLGQLRIPGGLKDPSFLLVLVTILGLARWATVRRRMHWRSPLGFAVASGLAIPSILYLLRGQYPCYYAWMAYLPACVCLCSELAARRPRLTPMGGLVMPSLLLVLAGLVGLPFVTGLTLLQWTDRDYRNVEGLVEGRLGPDDVVYCDGAAYYAAKKRASVETGRRHLAAMTPRQKAGISAVVVDPAAMGTIQEMLGGQWEPCGEALRPARPLAWQVRSEYFLDQYALQVFRRRSSWASRRSREEAVR
ncbi:MAG: hypothetical protein JXB62_20885 [Pirellulales bacterium]|nr:hypothetical protein [Pirellulales bacterium]